MACRALGQLATVDASSLTVAELAGCLRGLEAAESALTAARARVLWAFRAANGPVDDGHGSAKTWVRWQTRVTEGAAGGAIAWARRLHAHPVVAGALANGQLSASWARTLCTWSDLLPEDARSRADQILTDAAVSGTELADVARLAAEIRRRTAGPDIDRSQPSDGFAERGLRLGVTFGGAGRLEANLSSGCAAALSAVLDALGHKAGPEDTRTRPQRYHDALAEACRRLVAAGGLPHRAGQPTQIQLHMSLDQLRGLAGGAEAEAAWADHRWPGADPGADCDATIIPIVSGHPDQDLLDRLAATLLGRDPGQPPVSPARGNPGHSPACPPPRWPGRKHSGGRPDRAGPGNGYERPGRSGPGDGLGDTGRPGPANEPKPPGGPGNGRDRRCQPRPDNRHEHPSRSGPGNQPEDPAGTEPGNSGEQPGGAGSEGGSERPGESGRANGTGEPGRSEPGSGRGETGESGWRAARAVRQLLLARAADILSGPAGLAAWLRTGLLDGPAASVSLPLDIGAAAETIPVHLRRAVIARDEHCRFPGCLQPPAAGQVHHVIPRSEGGATALGNLLLLCTFHHLIVIHRWAWAIVLNPDGTTVATSPDGTRRLAGR